MRFRKATFNFSIHDSQRSILLRAPVLYESDDEVDEVYFPLSGMISLLVVMRDGKAIETATVGREGVRSYVESWPPHI